jgi:hypothetical protein
MLLPYGSSAALWSGLGNAVADLVLSNTTFNTTFNQTSAVNWIIANTTAATNVASQNSPIIQLNGTYWNGAASAADSWSIRTNVANGTNGASTLQLNHSGSTGAASVSAPNLYVTSATGTPNLGSSSTTGFYVASGRIDVNPASGTCIWEFGNGNSFVGGSGQVLQFSSNANPASGGRDVGISRLAAASLALGNGTAADISGALTLLNLNTNATTAATSGTATNSGTHTFAGQYWNGSVSAADSWTIQNVIGTGTNGTSQLTFTHAGTSGAYGIVIPIAGGAGTTVVNNCALQFGTNVGLTGSPASTLDICTGAAISELRFYANGNLEMQAGYQINSGVTGHNCIQSNNTNLSIFIRGQAVANTTPCVGLGHTNAAFSATSGTQVGVTMGTGTVHSNSGAALEFAPASGTANFIAAQIVPYINQTAGCTGSYTALLINPTENSALGTSNKLLDCQIGGTSKFALDNTGKIIVPSTNTATTATAGANGAVPAQVVGYLKINVNGTDVKVPYFAV